MSKKLDIVTSAYNEEESLIELYTRIKSVLASEKTYEWRLIICENVSTDNTWKVIESIAKEDLRVLGIQFSRNFYFDGGLTCGLDQCDGDLAIVMCSDLQDPPELIPQMLRKYEEGYEQVLMHVNSRASTGFALKLFIRSFYWLINKVSGGLVSGNVSDFRLLSRKAYIAARKLREQKRFMRGLMSWSGFRSCEIYFDRPPRKYGESKFNRRKLVSIVGDSFESIFAFSMLPLKLITGLGLFFSFISFVSLIFFVYSILSEGVPFPGFGTLVVMNLATFSLLLLVLGILSSYIGLIYEETKQRPLYVISKTTNSM